MSTTSEEPRSRETPPPRPPLVSKLRDLAKKIGVLAVSLLFCLIVLEIYVRATWQSHWHIPKTAVRAPGIFSARMKPSHEVDIPIMDGGTFHVKTNERGFRGPLVSTLHDKPLKILSLGDSFTFAWGLAVEEHCMWRFTEKYRAAHPDRDVGHAYVACGSWDPKDYYYGYVTEASAEKPDIVVLGVFTGNDIMAPDAPRILDPALVKSVDEIPNPPRPLIRSFDWISAQLSGSMLIAQVGFRAKRGATAFSMFEKDMERQKKLWDTSLYYIKALNDAVRRDGGRLALIVYPSVLEVAAYQQLENGGYDSTMPEKVLEAFSIENKIHFIGPLSYIRAKNQKRDLFFIKDRHMTARGNEVMADLLMERLAPVVDEVWKEKRARAEAKP